MQFIIKGFTQEREFRVFAFEGIAPNQIRIEFTVRADLALTRRYGIRQQELPLMCRAVLEGREEGDPENAMTFSEEAMRIHEANCIAVRALARKKTFGSAWRPQQPDAAGLTSQPEAQKTKLEN